jgi:dTDP-4-dehydrorhamnose 3,5-epimerase
MHCQPLALAGLQLLTPTRYEDERGFFLETFRQQDFVQHCGNYQLVQDNLSRSKQGVLRGLHYQWQRPQGKLIRVNSGTVFDVVVDLRRSSATFGQWLGLYLHADQHQQLWVPPGFAHGFYVCSAAAEVQYKCTDYYQPGDEYCIHWQDPTLAIEWPCGDETPLLSAKDQQGILLSASLTFD